MQCIPRKAELLLINDKNRVRVVEIHHPPLIKAKAKHITLSSRILNASRDGSFLFVFQRSMKFLDHKEESVSTQETTLWIDATIVEKKIKILGINVLVHYINQEAHLTIRKALFMF